MKARVLVIDDEPIVLKAAKAALSQVFDVITACGGAEGIASAMKERPDVVVCDVMMPDVNGEEVLIKLKLAALPTRFIFCTGLSKTVKDTVRFIKMGACDVIHKPFTAEDITNCVKRTLAVDGTLMDQVAEPAPLVQKVLAEAEKLESDRKRFKALERSVSRKRTITSLVYLAAAVVVAAMAKMYGLLSEGWAFPIFALLLFSLLALPLSNATKVVTRIWKTKTEVEFERFDD